MGRQSVVFPDCRSPVTRVVGVLAEQAHQDGRDHAFDYGVIVA